LRRGNFHKRFVIARRVVELHGGQKQIVGPRRFIHPPRCFLRTGAFAEQKRERRGNRWRNEQRRPIKPRGNEVQCPRRNKCQKINAAEDERELVKPRAERCQLQTRGDTVQKQVNRGLFHGTPPLGTVGIDTTSSLFPQEKVCWKPFANRISSL
jgi:hypothetical protein